MAFKLPEKYKEKQEEIYNLKFITIGDQKVHVTDLEDKTVTPEQYKQMVMNSYAQDELPPKLTDKALIEKAKHYLSQCPKPISCTTYNESLIHTILPELIKRLENK